MNSSDIPRKREPEFRARASRLARAVLDDRLDFSDFLFEVAGKADTTNDDDIDRAVDLLEHYPVQEDRLHHLLDALCRESPSDPEPTVTIYVYLPDEAVDVWRPVQALPVRPHVFKIASTIDDPDEIWQFQPGDLVRCESRKLSGGTFPVAVERVPD